jgi:hypothetical protein
MLRVLQYDVGGLHLVAESLIAKPVPVVGECGGGAVAPSVGQRLGRLAALEVGSQLLGSVTECLGRVLMMVCFLLGCTLLFGVLGAHCVPPCDRRVSSPHGLCRVRHGAGS